MPRWFPQGMVSRAESWIVEESEVDPFGKVIQCRTRNLDHVKIMRVEEFVEFRQSPEGYETLHLTWSTTYSYEHFRSKTLQHTEARIFSGFGWGLTKRIENHGLSRFKANLQRVRRSSSATRLLLKG